MKANSKLIIYSVSLLSFIVLFLLIYFPVIEGRYLFALEYRYIWTCNFSDQCQTAIPESFSLFFNESQFEGRPLYDYYLYLIFGNYINPLKSIEAAGTVRFIGVVVLGLLAYALFIIMKTNGIKTIHSFLLSVLICTLPPIQVFIGRLNNIVLFMLAALMSSLAAMIMLKTFFGEVKKKPAHMVFIVMLSMFFILFTLNSYQPINEIYWALVLIPVLMLKDDELLNKRFSFAIYLIAGVAASLTYFVGVKIFVRYFIDPGVLVRLLGENVLLGINDIIPKLTWFVNYPFYSALNLWNVFPDNSTAIIVITIIAAGFLCSLSRVLLQMKKEREGSRPLLILLFRYLLILMILPLSFVSNFAIKQSMPAYVQYSTLLGLEVFVILLCYWGVMNIIELIRYFLGFSEDLKKKIVTAGLVIVAFFAAYSSNHSVDNYIVKLQQSEFQYMKDAIQEYGISKLKENPNIYVLRSDHDPDKFWSVFTWQSSWLFPAPVVTLALDELGLDSSIFKITHSRKGNYSMPDVKDTLVINMLDWQKNEFKKLNIPLDLPQIIKPPF